MNDELKERLAHRLFYNDEDDWDALPEHWKQDALDSVGTIEAELAAAGYAVVPRGSSIMMEEAGCGALGDVPNPVSLYAARSCYLAMIAAAEGER